MPSARATAPRPTSPCRQSGRATNAGSRTSSSSRSSCEDVRGCDRTTVPIFFNFRPDRARQLSQRLLEANVDLTTMTRYREDFAVPCRVRRADRDEHARGRARGEWSAAAARRGDREIRPRDVLLQRWRRGRARGRDPDPRSLAERRRELRPEARDVGSRGHRSTLRRARPRVPVRSRELREPRHGRSHRLDSGRRERCRDGGSLPRDGGRVVSRLPAACAS